jgi:sialidase-1
MLLALAQAIAALRLVEAGAGSADAPLLPTPFPPQMDLFAAGDPMLPVAGSAGPARPVACYRLPVLLAAPNSTLIAFASARNWTGDGCHPKHPVIVNPSPGGGNLTQYLALRVSKDRGATWGPIRQATAHQFIDFQAVYDSESGAIIVMSCYSPKAPHASSCGGGGNWIQTRSTDLGRTFTEPTAIKPSSATALGPAAEQGLTMGPARALQLRTGTHAGRLLFCAHQTAVVDHHPGSIAPVFVSDDGGRSYRTTSVLPRGVPGDMHYGPDECSMVELSNGTVRLDGRNNWYDQTKHYTRTYFLSTDAGETFGAQQFDDALSLDPTCPGSQLSLRDASGRSLWLSGPVADGRSPDPWRARVNMSVHRSTSLGDTWSPPVQVVDGPSGYNCLSELQVSEESGSGTGLGLLF